MSTCPQCLEVNPPSAHFCAACGARLLERPEETTGSLDVIDPSVLVQEEGTESMEPAPTGGYGYLMIQIGQEAGSWFQLDRKIMSIGRHPDSDIFLNDVTVSRRHAEVELRDEGYYIKDAGSLNGTYVDRERVEEEKLCPGNEIQIGKFRLLFLQQGQGS
ncbi:MAG: FHA domain-containing protein [Ferrimicrobium sp.]|uniref:FHA domain-containing protein n=1 Tax=Ferrimicrobium sp. TaxID=2926050 RepID=UPI002637E227|nr:FHA domain-containing protein [Ferrimicrobium sp.]